MASVPKKLEGPFGFEPGKLGPRLCHNNAFGLWVPSQCGVPS